MERTDHFATRVQALSDLLDEVSGIEGLAPLDMADEGALLCELREEQDRPLRVAILGEFSSGKSTFINAILGEDLLPAQYLPTTLQLMYIRHSDGPAQVAVAAADAGASTDTLATKVSEDAARAAVLESATPQALSRQSVLDLAATGEPLEIVTSIPPPWTDFEICDTPGVNDATSMAENVIFDLMDRVDVVVLMLRAQQALTASESEFIGQLVRQKDLDKFFFNINFCDSLAADQAISVRDHVVQTLGELRNWPIKGLQDRVFLCSARQTLDTALGKTVPANIDQPNQHASLLAAVHAYASTRRQALRQEAGEVLINALAASAASKLSEAMDAADEKDASQGEALIEINQAVTDFRVAIREEELALQNRISERKASLLRDVSSAFTDIERTLQDYVSSESFDELAGPGLSNRLQIAVEEQLAPLLSEFRADLHGAFADIDQRIMPMAARTSERIEGIRQSYDLGPLLAGTSVATAGYVVVSAALPWALGAGGVLAVTAGLASLIPGVGGLVGAGLVAATARLPRMLMSAAGSTASGTASGYRWLRNETRKWQAKRTREAYGKQASTLVGELRREVAMRLDDAIDPKQLIEGAMTARFPEGLMLEERRLRAVKLDRKQLRDTRQHIERLRAEFISQISPMRTSHD